MKKYFHILNLLLMLLFSVTRAAAQWIGVNHNLPDGCICTIATTDNKIFVGTHFGNIYLSTDNGDSWSLKYTDSTTHDIFSIVANGSDVYAVSLGNGFLFSSDSGNTWSLKNSGLINLDLLSVVVSGKNIFVGSQTGAGGVFLSTNNGDSWVVKNYGLTDINIHALATGGNYLYAGTGSGVFQSEDNGGHWTQKNNGLPATEIFSLLVNGNYIFAGSREIYKSDNNGTSWSKFSTGTDGSSIFSFTSSGINLLAGDESGVYLSSDNGGTWKLKPIDSLDFPDVHTIASSGNYILAGTWCTGVFRTTLEQLDVKEELSFESEFSVHPNPVQSILYLHFGCVTETLSRIYIYDMYGRLMTEGTIPPGATSWQVNAERFPAGMYICKLIKGENVKSLKFIVVR